MRNRLRLRFIYSYLIILLVAVLMMTGVVLVSFGLFRQDITQKNARLLDHVKVMFDIRLSEISKLSYEVGANDQLREVMRQGTSASLAQAAQLTRYLSGVKSVSQTMADMAVYFPKSDAIINGTGKFMARHYYRLTHRSDPVSYRAFRQVLYGAHKLEFTVEDVTPLSGPSERVIMFYHTLHLSGAGANAPLLMIRLDNAKVKAMMLSSMMGDSEYFAILDEYDRPVVYSGNAKLYDLALPELSASPVDGTTLAQGGALVISRATSDYGGIRYLSISSESKFLGRLNTVRNILPWCILAILAVGLVISIFFTRRNEKPLIEITRAIGEPGSRGGDVYAYIESNIRRLMQENDTISHRMEAQRGALKRSFVLGLLRGEILDAEQFQSGCFQYGLRACGVRHCAFIVYVHAVPPSVEQSVSGLLDYEDAMLALLRGAAAVLGNQPAPSCEAEIVVLDGVYSGWLLLPDCENASTLEQTCLAALRGRLFSEYGVRVSLAGGGVCHEFSQIARSYREAMKALDMLISRGEEDTLIYGDADRGGPGGTDVAIDLIGQFSNCLRLQDYENALRMLSELSDGYLLGIRSPEVSTLHKSAVRSVVMDALDQACEMYSCREELAPFMQAPPRAPSAEAVRLATEAALKKLVEVRNRQEAAHAGKRLEELKHHILTHFAQPEMGLTFLAEEFHMNAGYLSKAFKREFGVGVLDYINKVRVEQAKTLLAETKLNVAEIARQVGYLSDISFIRVFKRYEGTTPGRFREGAVR